MRSWIRSWSDGTRTTVVGALITGAFGLGIWYLSRPATQRSASELNVEDSLRRRVQADSILKAYYPGHRTVMADAMWIDLYGDGKRLEFYSFYHADGLPCLDLFTYRHGFAELLFHRADDDPLTGSFQGANYRMNGKTIFVMMQVMGSGDFLYVDIFDLDPAGKLRTLYHASDLPQGVLIALGDAIYLRASTAFYKLTFDSSRTKLVRSIYHERLKYIEGSSMHVISVLRDTNRLRLAYDNVPIRFHSSGDTHYSDVIDLKKGQMLQFDPNISYADGQLRIDKHWFETFQRRNGLFEVFQPAADTCQLAFNLDYAPDWYVLVFSVDTTTIMHPDLKNPFGLN